MPDAVAAIAAQRGPGLFILASDGSTDNTVEVLHEEAACDPRIEVLSWSGNKGAAYARHRCLHSGLVERDDIVMLLGLDDVLSNPKAFRRVHKEYDHGADVTHGTYEFLGGNGWTVASPYTEKELRDRNFRHIGWRCIAPQTFRADLGMRVRPEDMQDDHGNWVRAATELALMMPVLEMAHSIHYIPDVLVQYRHNHSNSVRRRERPEYRAQTNKLIRRKAPYDRI